MLYIVYVWGFESLHTFSVLFVFGCVVCVVLCSPRTELGEPQEALGGPRQGSAESEAQRTSDRADGGSCRAPQTLWPHRPGCSYSAARLQSVIAGLASGDVCQRHQLGRGPAPQSSAELGP